MDAEPTLAQDPRAAEAGPHDATRGVMMAVVVGAALWCALIGLLGVALG